MPMDDSLEHDQKNANVTRLTKSKLRTPSQMYFPTEQADKNKKKFHNDIFPPSNSYLASRARLMSKASSYFTSCRACSDLTARRASFDLTAGRASSDLTAGRVSSCVTKGRTSSYVTNRTYSYLTGWACSYVTARPSDIQPNTRSIINTSPSDTQSIINPAHQTTSPS